MSRRKTTCTCKPVAPLPPPVLRQGRLVAYYAALIEEIRPAAEAWIDDLIAHPH